MKGQSIPVVYIEDGLCLPFANHRGARTFLVWGSDSRSRESEYAPQGREGCRPGEARCCPYRHFRCHYGSGLVRRDEALDLLHLVGQALARADTTDLAEEARVTAVACSVSG